MTHNEKVTVAFEVLGNDATTLDEETLDARILEAYSQNDPDGYNDMQQNGVSSAIIVEQAYEYFMYSHNFNTEDIQADMGDINTNPYGSSRNINSELTREDIPKEVTSNNIKNDKKKARKREDVTEKLASSLPENAQSLVEDYIKADFSTLMMKSNSTELDKYLINTPIRQYLIDRTFSVSPDAAKKFLDKYESIVVDDNQYDPNDKTKITVEGENVKAFKEIKALLLSGGVFEVNVPAASSQKIIGVKLIRKLDGKNEPDIIPVKDLAVTLLCEYGGRIPGDPGLEVKKPVQNTPKNEKEKIKIFYSVSYIGKAKALQETALGVDSKYAEQTSVALDENDAIDKYGSANNTITVKSVLKFKVQENKEGANARTVRVPGKIEVPFFARKEEYLVKFGEPESRKYVKELSIADKDAFIALSKAYAIEHADTIASKWNLSSLLSAIDNANTEPSDLDIPPADQIAQA